MSDNVIVWPPNCPAWFSPIPLAMPTVVTNHAAGVQVVTDIPTYNNGMIPALTAEKLRSRNGSFWTRRMAGLN